MCLPRADCNSAHHFTTFTFGLAFFNLAMPASVDHAFQMGDAGIGTSKHFPKKTRIPFWPSYSPLTACSSCGT